MVKLEFFDGFVICMIVKFLQYFVICDLDVLAVGLSFSVLWASTGFYFYFIFYFKLHAIHFVFRLMSTC